MKIPLKN